MYIPSLICSVNFCNCCLLLFILIRLCKSNYNVINRLQILMHLYFDTAGSGGPVLYKHLFGFFEYPEVNILILQGLGIVNLISILSKTFNI